MKKLLTKLGFIRPSGSIDWDEIRFDTTVIIFLGGLFYALWELK